MQNATAEVAAGQSPAVDGYVVIRIILGLLLLTASFLKGHQLATEPVAESGFLSSRVFLIILIELELFLGLWLIAGVYSRIAWTVTVACFALFAAITLYKALGGEENCGCFGRVKINPWYTFTFDVAVLIGLLIFRPSGTDRPRYMRVRFVGVILLAGLIGTPAAIAMASYEPAQVSNEGAIFGDSDFVVLEPEKWVGQAFPLSKHIDVGEHFENGDWFVVFYHHDCPSCQEALSKLRLMVDQLAETKALYQIALVDVPPHGEHPPFSPSVSRMVHFAKLSVAKEWFVVTPSAVFLSNGMVKKAWDKTIPTEHHLLLEYLN